MHKVKPPSPSVRQLWHITVNVLLDNISGKSEYNPAEKGKLIMIANPVEVATNIVAAFVSNNSIPSSEVALLIESVHAALSAAANGAIANGTPIPAVSVSKSLTSDYMICLDDGKRCKSLRRHLAALGMTPEQYRAKWGLPSDYPMVAPNYAAKRSEMAKSIGLGRRRYIPADALASTVPLEVAAKHKPESPRKGFA